MKAILVAAVVFGITAIITTTLVDGNGEAHCDIRQTIIEDFAHFVGCDPNDVTATLEGSHSHIADGSSTCMVLFEYPSEVDEEQTLECTQTVSCPQSGQCEMIDPDPCPNHRSGLN